MGGKTKKEREAVDGPASESRSADGCEAERLIKKVQEIDSWQMNGTKRDVIKIKVDKRGYEEI